MTDFRHRYGPAALVTGASSGIGAAFARGAAERGLDVALVARRGALLDALAAEIRARHGVRAEAIPLDLTAPDATAALVRACEERGLEIGLLVANAGLGAFGSTLETPPATVATMLALNVRAVTEHVQAFVPAMASRRRGGVILLSSIGAYQASPFWGIYGATKAYNLMFAESLWYELKPFGVDALGLSPGATRSGFHDVAGVDRRRLRVPWSTPESVVASAFRALGHQPSVVPGLPNAIAAFGVRLVPRALATRIAGWTMDPRRLGLVKAG